MSTLDILKKGRSRIEKNWIQERYIEPHWFGPHGYCTLAAINADEMSVHALRESLIVLRPDYSHGIVSFNDSTSTRKEDVLALFDHAIKSIQEAV